MRCRSTRWPTISVVKASAQPGAAPTSAAPLLATLLYRLSSRSFLSPRPVLPQARRSTLAGPYLLYALVCSALETENPRQVKNPGSRISLTLGERHLPRLSDSPFPSAPR